MCLMCATSCIHTCMPWRLYSAKYHHAFIDHFNSTSWLHAHNSYCIIVYRSDGMHRTYIVHMIWTSKMSRVCKGIGSQIPLVPSAGCCGQLNSRLWITIITKLCHPNCACTACRDGLDTGRASTGCLKLENLILVIVSLNVIVRLSDGTSLMCQVEVI